MTSIPLHSLLAQAGAKLRSSKRADCPRCGGRRTVSYTDEVFHCHHAGCDFSGNAIALAHKLGREVPRESVAQRTRRLTIARESERIQRWATMRWRFLADLNHLLLDIERLARQSGRESLERGEPVPESVWANLDWSLRQQEKLWAELCLFGGPEPGSGQAARWARVIRARYYQAKQDSQKRKAVA